MRWRLAAIAAVAVVFNSGDTKAGLISGFGGNTQPVIGGTKGFINFAVFNTAGGVVGDRFDTGHAGIDASLKAAGFNTSSNFLYLFQDVNTGPDIASGSVHVVSSSVTGFGFLSGLNYTEVTGAHSFLGSVAAVPGNISPAVTDATQAEATITGGASISPTSVTLNPTSLVATFSPAMIGHGTFSSLWGYTSNLSPNFTVGSIQDSGLAANGTVPGTAVPEPSSLLLAMVGMVSSVAAVVRRRFRMRHGR